MQCPYCGSSELINKNLNHVFFCKKCNKNVLKKCYRCGKETYANIDECPFCRAWLPDLPTSWIRSATHLQLLFRVVKIVHDCLKDKATHEDLGFALLFKELAVVDPRKLMKKGINYLKDTPFRRGREYALNALYLGLLTRSSKKPYVYSVTPIGQRFLSTGNPLERWAIIVDRICKLKLTNIYDEAGTYKRFRFRPFLTTMNLIKKLEERGIKVTLNKLALAFLCKNENADLKKALMFAEKYTDDELSRMFFSNSREVQRAIKGVVIPWLKELLLIATRNNAYYLTDIGKKVCNIYASLTPLWYEDIKNDNEVARILLYRLVRNRLLSDTSLISIGSILSIKTDYDFDIFYDIPVDKRKKLLHICSKFLKDNINIEELFKKLQLNEAAKILNLLTNEEKEKINEVFQEMEGKNLRLLDRKTGSMFEKKVLDVLKELRFEAYLYRDERTFSSITFPPELRWALKGEARENPDIIVYRPLLLLVDPKDDVNNELFKLRAYDYYACHPEVNAHACVIITKKPLKEFSVLNNVTRIVIMTYRALLKLEERKEEFSMNEICSFFVPLENRGRYVSASDIERDKAISNLKFLQIYRVQYPIDNIRRFILGPLSPMAINILTRICKKYDGEIRSDTIINVLEELHVPKKDENVLYWKWRILEVLTMIQKYWNTKEKIYEIEIEPKEKIKVKEKYRELLALLDQSSVNEYKELTEWLQTCISVGKNISKDLRKMLNMVKRVTIKCLSR